MRTQVIFYKEDTDVLAVFPKEMYLDFSTETVVCYAPVGQHSACSKDYYKTLEPAKPNEYYNLKKELESLGYRLKILNKQ